MHDACSRVVISPMLSCSRLSGRRELLLSSRHTDPADIRPVDPKASASCAISITAKQLLGPVLCNCGMDPSSIVDLCRISFTDMKEFAQSFYTSRAWANTRAAYRRQVGGLCERCLSRGLIVPGEIVHHKVPITPDNIDNPAITLSFDNLELVCRECHAIEHGAKVRRYKVDEFGRVTLPPGTG